MGHSQAEKARNHHRIVQLASARFRELGIDGISVADLMKEAGMTHGGFYKHFPSRDDLVTEAVEYALASGAKNVARVEALDRRSALLALINGYLSVAHRDAKANGCAVVALAADTARANPKVRAAYSAQVSRYLQLLARLTETATDTVARNRAIMLLSALVGALGLARAVDDERLSVEILEATADGLINSIDAPPEP
jgi:TetR/AcrR family transcriptional repressor of nem operon